MLNFENVVKAPVSNGEKTEERLRTVRVNGSQDTVQKDGTAGE